MLTQHLRCCTLMVAASSSSIWPLRGMAGEALLTNVQLQLAATKARCLTAHTCLLLQEQSHSLNSQQQSLLLHPNYWLTPSGQCSLLYERHRDEQQLSPGQGQHLLAVLLVQLA